jgi:hypothetical protein
MVRAPILNGMGVFLKALAKNQKAKTFFDALNRANRYMLLTKSE